LVIVVVKDGNRSRYKGVKAKNNNFFFVGDKVEVTLEADHQAKVVGFGNN